MIAETTHKKRSPFIELSTTKIAYKEWLPLQNETAKQRAIVYLPGFSLHAHTSSVARLGSSLSDAGYRAEVVYSLPKKIIEDSLPQEAKDINTLLSEQHPHQHFILVAHSKAATKAIDFTAYNNEGLEGLVLITPIGLYPRKEHNLSRLFAEEVIRNSIPSIVKEHLSIGIRREDRRTTELAIGVISTALSELANFGLLYGKRLGQEVHELAQRAPQRVIAQLQKLSIPIEVVLGGKDQVAEPYKIREILDSLGLPNISITQEDNLDHGLPYTHPEIVLDAVTRIEKRLQTK